MKQLLITIAALVLVGCGEPRQSISPEETNSIVEFDVSGDTNSFGQIPISKSLIELIEKTSIFEAAEQGNIAIVKHHLSNGADVNIKSEDGSTLLDFAAMCCSYEITELLVSKGIDINYIGPLGVSHAHNAAANGCEKIIKLLFQKGANVNVIINSEESPFYGLSPLDAAYLAEEKQTAKVLRELGAVHASLHGAVLSGEKDTLKKFINDGMNVNQKIYGNNTPLIMAVREGKYEISEILLNSDSDFNSKDSNGRTALDWAQEKHNMKIADLLRKHGGKTSEELKAEGK